MKLLFPVLFAALLLFPACGGSPTDPSVNANVAYSQTDLTVGSGKVAAAGNTVTTNYTLWLYNPNAADNKGTLIQTSVGGAPFTFVLGTNSVIKGFDQGTVGMAVGGKRRIIIPPSLGYGNQVSGNGAIPANSTLVFEVELLNVV